MFAATYPHRAAAVITIGSYARRLKAPDYPYFVDREEALKGIAAFAEEWGGPVFIEHRLPSVSNDPIVRKWWSKFLRMSASASAAAALQRMNIDIDIRHILPSIRVPTLILHATNDRVVPFQAGRYMADRIPHARFVEVNSIDHLPFYDKPDEFIRHIEEFLTGTSRITMAETSVRTLMFTDIVGSTKLAVEKRDQRFSDLLEAHHAAVRRELSFHRGQEINTTGDGFVASFDGPARAIRCAVEFTRSLTGIGVTSRVGLHTGECEIREGGLHGVALHIASRVCDLAPPGGVLVSQTVRDLVAGSGLRFADRGSHSLKGLPDQWRLFEVELVGSQYRLKHGRGDEGTGAARLHRRGDRRPCSLLQAHMSASGSSLPVCLEFGGQSGHSVAIATGPSLTQLRHGRLDFSQRKSIVRPSLKRDIVPSIARTRPPRRRVTWQSTSDGGN